MCLYVAMFTCVLFVHVLEHAQHPKLLAKTRPLIYIYIYIFFLLSSNILCIGNHLKMSAEEKPCAAKSVVWAFSLWISVPNPVMWQHCGTMTLRRVDLAPRAFFFRNVPSPQSR